MASSQDLPTYVSTLLTSFTSRIANQTSLYSTLTLPLPLAPIHPLSALLEHITSKPVHEVYFPFLRFGAIHAVRTTTMWAAMTRGKDRGGVSRLQDLFGYLTLAWGGGTIASMLLSQPPPWLISPTPWLIYPLIYTLLIPTGLSSYIITTCPPLIFNTFGAYVDGIIRGTTIASLPSAIASSGLKTSWLTPVLLSGIAVSSSGWLVTGLSMHESDWSLGKPSVLNGGALDTMDLWGGMLVGLVNAALMRSHAELAPLSGILLRALPSDMQTVGASSGSKPVVTPAIGRAICVLLLGSLLCARVIAKAVLDYRKSCKTKMKKAKKTPATTTVTTKEVLREKPREEVLKSPAKTEKRGTTPRKSPRPKKT